MLHCLGVDAIWGVILGHMENSNGNRAHRGTLVFSRLDWRITLQKDGQAALMAKYLARGCFRKLAQTSAQSIRLRSNLSRTASSFALVNQSILSWCGVHPTSPYGESAILLADIALATYHFHVKLSRTTLGERYSTRFAAAFDSSA